MYTRRASSSLALMALVGVVLRGFGCPREPEKGVPVEQSRETLSAEEQPKPIASSFINPAQGCALILSSDEFRVSPNPDVLAECREDYGVTLENASERVQQGVDEAILKAEASIGKGE